MYVQLDANAGRVLFVLSSDQVRHESYRRALFVRRQKGGSLLQCFSQTLPTLGEQE